LSIKFADYFAIFVCFEDILLYVFFYENLKIYQVLDDECVVDISNARGFEFLIIG